MEHGFIISLKDIYVEFDNEIILNKINLNIKDKEFVTFLGPSGCGKTTTLRIIGGFLTPDSGDIFFEGEKINGMPPHKRNVNTVFQKYALFPHLNVYENVAFGLRLKKMPEAQIKQKVTQMLNIVDLKGYEKRSVSKLSGGQQQRVAIARALVCDPKVLLLDEPLGALDLKLRKDMQIELKRIQKQTQTTFIYVTHDQEEALTMSDTVVVMNNGVIEQIGTPTDIYNEPANAFVADFIGEANILNGTMLNDFSVSVCGAQFTCIDKGFEINQPVDVVIRPEDIDIIDAEKAKLKGPVVNAVFKGVHYEMTVDIDGCMWLIHSTSCQPVGKTVGIDFIPDNIHIMNKMFSTSDNIFKADVTYCNAQENYFEIEVEGKALTVHGKTFEEGTKLSIKLAPEDIYIAGDGNGDFTAYIVSVIYKGSHNEIILETDERKWIMNCEQDEQVATYVPICFNLDNAEFTVIDTSSEVTGGEI
ncbi:MAG: polyamine ABC transporter ATP-binding protein [Ruminococcaceae bacterium]|nr:polyamine ABC transporter ATP-binding protein [Oscillospiraceae bacterium]